MTLAGVKGEAGVHTENEFRKLRKQIRDLEDQVSKIFKNNAVVVDNPLTSFTIESGGVVRSVRTPTPTGPLVWFEITGSGDNVYFFGKDQNDNWHKNHVGKIQDR